ncbi:hypothetical protein [Streptomyces sp. JJ36]|uniref:hypothetical protein n=1 Tax=Streptomyces sp. JJ36 TaxID=2736645 RepID=UPI001F1EE2D0|nr:hypothetical protein [Streptomyces sp. JJ36]MCF6525031.1 hypothetical protein [Streptomyces sp. JJ36]
MNEIDKTRNCGPGEASPQPQAGDGWGRGATAPYGTDPGSTAPDATDPGTANPDGTGWDAAALRRLIAAGGAGAAGAAGSVEADPNGTDHTPGAHPGPAGRARAGQDSAHPEWCGCPAPVHRPAPAASGDPSAPGSGMPPDAALRDLAAALNTARTARPGPLPDPGPALAAYRAEAGTARAPAPAPGTLTRLRRWGRRLGRARTSALAGALVAALGGGVAVAAGGVPFTSPGDDTSPAHGFPSPGASPPAEPSDAQDAAPDRTDHRNAPHPAAPSGGASTLAEKGDGVTASGTPGPPTVQHLVAQCRIHARDPHVTLPAVTTAAGGEDRVPAYCARLLAAHPAPRPTPDAPVRQDEPSGVPSADPTDPAADPADAADPAQSPGAPEAAPGKSAP